MRVQFSDLHESARVWTFGSSRMLTPAEEARLLGQVDAFLDEWKAHGSPLTCARDWREHRFLAIAVDQRDAHASGCSIDGLYRVLAAAERELDLRMLGGGLVHYRGQSGDPVAVTREEFGAAAARGEVSGNTPVFDLTVRTVDEWRSSFEKPAAGSWHAQLLPVAQRA